MSDATVVRTTEDGFNAALIPLAEQYTAEKANANHILAPFIEGPPGIGKTEITRQIAEELGIKELLIISCGVIDTNLEFIGLPEIIRNGKSKADLKNSDMMGAVKKIDVQTGTEEIVETGEAEEIITKWIKPERLASFDSLGPNERGLLVFDDTHFLLERQQAMMMQLLTNQRTIHTHKVGDGSNVGVMFLANRMDDNAGAQDMLAPVIDRIKRIVVDVEPVAQSKIWCEWAEEAGAHPAIIGYIKSNPEMLYTFKPENELTALEDSQKFASPRGWKALSDEITALEKYSTGGKEANESLLTALPNATPELKQRLRDSANVWLNRQLSNYASGTVGSQAAKEFSAYYSIYQKYDLKPYLEGTKNLTDIPNSELAVASMRFATTLARDLGQFDLDVIEALSMFVVNKMPKSQTGTLLKGITDTSNIKTLEDLHNLDEDQYKRLLQCSVFLVLANPDLMRHPAQSLEILATDLEQEFDSTSDPALIESSLKESLSGCFAGIERPDLEDRLLKNMQFFSRFLQHIQKAVPERGAQMNAAFIGTFAAESTRAFKRVSRVFNDKTMVEQPVSRAAVNLFLTTLMKQSPSVLNFLNERVGVSELMQKKAEEASKATTPTKSTRKTKTSK